MSADGDEEALSWDGVADPSYVATPAKQAAPVVDPASVVEPVETPSARPGISSFLLVTYGILAGAYLLYTVGWVIGIRQVVFVEIDTLSRIMSVVMQVLAVAAPAIWFGATFVLTRRARPIVRLLLLLAGLVATLPLPFILLGASS